MTVMVKQNGAFQPLGGGDGGGGEDDLYYWERPAEWLALPQVLETDQKLVGLLAVDDNDSNYVTLQAQGAFTVDWGDGSAPEHFASNAVAVHKYAYSTLPGNTTTSRGQRQAIVTLTPQAGQSLTALTMNVEPSPISASGGTTSGWLDCWGRGEFLATLVVGQSPTQSATLLRHRMMERFVWEGPNNLTSLPLAFGTMTALQVVELDTSKVTNFSSTFSSCTGMRHAPEFDTSAATNMSSMFSNCSSLVTVPHYDTGLVTSLSNMFEACRSLRTVPEFDMGNVTVCSFMFQNCASLRSVPALNTSQVAGASMSAMFKNCASLHEAPMMDTSKVTSFYDLFNGCSALSIVPLYDTSQVTTFELAFSGCSALRTVPEFNMTKTLVTKSMFSTCSSLTHVPLFNMATVTDVSSMFATCISLREVPAFDWSKVMTMTVSPFNGCQSLLKSEVRNLRYSHSYASASLVAAELNRIYTNLLPIINLLSANASSVETSAADWVSGGNATLARVLRAGPGMEGSATLEWTAVAAGVSTVNLATRAPVTAGQTYTGAVAATTSRALTVGLVWHDGGGTPLSTDWSAAIAQTGSTVAVTAAAPAGAVTVALTMKFTATSSGQAASADQMRINPGTETMQTLQGQTVTVTGNLGVAGDDPTIATTKGWTVVG